MWLVGSNEDEDWQEFDAEHSAMAKQRLLHLTSDRWDDGTEPLPVLGAAGSGGSAPGPSTSAAPPPPRRPDGSRKVFSGFGAELEECDFETQDTRLVQFASMAAGGGGERGSAEAMPVPHSVDLDHFRFLFGLVTTKPDGTTFPLVVTSSDVHGVVWDVSGGIGEDGAGVAHLATFEALSFVLASKRARKFLSVTPTLTHAVMAEESARVVVYGRVAETSSGASSSTASTSGGRASLPAHTAPQHIVSLPEGAGGVVGLHAGPASVFVLCENCVVWVDLGID